ncbi:hypothetical protein LEMLEM_LOCUS8129 [Lemmus lemmus]
MPRSALTLYGYNPARGAQAKLKPEPVRGGSACRRAVAEAAQRSKAENDPMAQELGASPVCKESPGRRPGSCVPGEWRVMVACSGDVFVFPFSCRRWCRKDSPANTMQQAVSLDSRALLPLHACEA